jgi:hypothetical protein
VKVRAKGNHVVLYRQLKVWVGHINELHVQKTVLGSFNVFDLKKSAPDSTPHVVWDSIFIKKTVKNPLARKLQVDILLEGKNLLPFLISKGSRFGVNTTLNLGKSWKR